MQNINDIEQRINNGFDPELYSGLFELEAEHFWFKSRNKLLTWTLKKYFPEATSLLEIGCGTGYVLDGLQQNFNRIKFSGSELFDKGLEYAKQRCPLINLFQLDAREMNFINKFDIIGAFDVIEHIKEDDLILQNMYKAVKEGGGGNYYCSTTWLVMGQV